MWPKYLKIDSGILCEVSTCFIWQVKAGQTVDLSPSLKKLEISLKNEGSYKNVKVGFESAKTEINEVCT